MVGLGASELDDYARKPRRSRAGPCGPMPEPEKGFYYRSDHFNFAKQGVPALDPDSGTWFIRASRRSTASRSGTSTPTRLPRPIGRGETGLGPDRRRRGRRAVLRGRIPGRQRRPLSRMDGRQRVQGEAGCDDQEVDTSFQLPAARYQLPQGTIGRRAAATLEDGHGASWSGKSEQEAGSRKREAGSGNSSGENIALSRTC